MKRILSFITLLIMAGCTQSYEDVATISASEEFFATIEGSDTDTRTYVDGNITTRWHADDRLTIFKKETYNREYKFKGKTGDNSGGFTQVSVDDDFYSSEQLDKNYAVYPHSNDNCFNKQTESFELIMPAEQTYAENTFGRGTNTMVAVSDTGQLLFKNVGSFLRVRLWGENTAVSSITITSNGDEVIAGEAIVKPTMGGDPTCVMTGSEKTITLNCPTPITISESEGTPTDFWIVLPPVTFEDGFTVTVKDSNDQVQTYEVNNSSTFERNKYYNLKREMTIGEPIDPSASIPDNQIWYTTTDGNIVNLNITVGFGSYDVKYKSNEYINGKGIITFNNPITEIANNAFKELTNLKSITLPNKLKSINPTAFYGCESLENITIPNSVTSIGSMAFYKCSSLIDITIPKGVTSIGSRAFSGCSSLIDITMPNELTIIEEATFQNCTNLTSITIPNKVTKIEGGYVSGAFDDCSMLKSVTISNGNISIGDYAFKGCSNLENVTMPAEGVCTIGKHTFEKCSKLVSFTIPDGTTTIGEYAFKGCSKLSTSLPNSIKSIGQYAFYDCANLNLTIPEKITKIEPYTFHLCQKFEGNLIIPNGVTEIGEAAFGGCFNMESVTIPKSVQKIGGNAFSIYKEMDVYIEDLEAWCNIDMGFELNCEPFGNYGIEYPSYKQPNYPYNLYLNNTLITDLIIPNDITSIKGHAFQNCGSIKSITFHNDVNLIGADAFRGCNNLERVNISDLSKWCNIERQSLCMSAHDLYLNDNLVQEITIPQECIVLPDATFQSCKSLTKVIIPENVTSLGVFAFEDCVNLQIVNIPSTITYIPRRCFMGCSNLSNVTISEGVQEFHSSAFELCKSLTQITIPSSVTDIWYDAFYGCSMLQNVYCRPIVPPVAHDIVSDWEAFAGHGTPFAINVPSESVENYKTASYWKNYAGYIEGYNF